MPEFDPHSPPWLAAVTQVTSWVRGWLQSEE